jgi:hypothetical protein
MKKVISDCRKLLKAYKNGDLGQTIMPEDSHPKFTNKEERLAYFTLPMALNYQRDSYKLWESALKTFNDKATKKIFNIAKVSKMSKKELQKSLLRYKLALQPNKHIDTWQKLSKTIYKNWSSFEKLFKSSDNDFLKLRETIQIEYKKDFPYLSGPKIFNYWSFIMSTYGGIRLKNKEYIDIAPDTHITKCSVKLGVISQREADRLTKEEISERWFNILKDTDISPIDMHPPLWFWSRNGFIFELV